MSLRLVARTGSLLCRRLDVRRPPSRSQRLLIANPRHCSEQRSRNRNTNPSQPPRHEERRERTPASLCVLRASAVVFPSRDFAQAATISRNAGRQGSARSHSSFGIQGYSLCKNANGVPSSSPGLARGTSAYPGDAVGRKNNPEGVASMRSKTRVQPKFRNWNASGKQRSCSAGFPACCIAGFQTRERWTSSRHSELSLRCRLGSRRYSRFGNLRYEERSSLFGIRIQPFQGCTIRCAKPRVAPVAQPWAEGWNVFGVLFELALLNSSLLHTGPQEAFRN